MSLTAATMNRSRKPTRGHPVALALSAGVFAAILAGCSWSGPDVDPGNSKGGGVPSSLHATGVEAFTLTDGQPQWAPAQERKVAGSVWRFDGSGSFQWRTTDTAEMADDLNGITGSYTLDGDVITFQGSRTADRSGVGSATVQINGTARPSGDGYTVRMQMVSSSGSAAVVDGQNFAAANGVANSSTLRASAP